MGWNRSWKLADKVKILAKFAAKIYKKSEKYFEAEFHENPLKLEIESDGSQATVVRLLDDPDDPDGFLLFSDYGEYGIDRPIPKKYMTKIGDLLEEAIIHLHFLAQPCCKKARRYAIELFSRKQIDYCPWCGTELWDRTHNSLVGDKHEI